MDEKIKKFCNKWKITEFSLFGSYITDKYTDKSDIDVLIDFDNSAKYGFFEMTEMKEELELIYGREIDLLTRNGIEKSKNLIRKESILNILKKIYAER